MTPKSKKIAGALALLGAGAAAIAIGTSNAPIDDKTVQLPQKVWAWPKTEPTTGTCAKTVFLYDPGCKLDVMEDRAGEVDDAGNPKLEASISGDANEALEKAPAGRYPYASLMQCWSKEVDAPAIKLEADCYTEIPGSRSKPYDFVPKQGWPRGILTVAWAPGNISAFDCACGPGATRTKTGKPLAPGEIANITDLTLGSKDWYKVPCSEFNLGRATSILPPECCVGASAGMQCGDDACGASAGTCASGTTCIGHQCVVQKVDILPDGGLIAAPAEKVTP